MTQNLRHTGPRQRRMSSYNTNSSMRALIASLSLVTSLSSNCLVRSAALNESTAFISGDGASRIIDAHKSFSTDNNDLMVDSEYPGTAVERLRNVHRRVSELASDDSLNGPWEDVRRKILWAGGLKDLPSARPGQGYTGHSFNDFNHVDLTCMNDRMSDNENDGQVKGIAIGNHLGEGIRIASLPELGPGGRYVYRLRVFWPK